MTADLVVAADTVAAISASPEWDALAEEYAAEAQIKGMPPHNARWDSYQAFEGMGFLRAFSARKDGALIGFISVLAAPLPRYAETVAVTESFFVARAQRYTGAGLKLLALAENCAKELGSRGLLVSAPIDGVLPKILVHRGYDPASLVFFKVFDA